MRTLSPLPGTDPITRIEHTGSFVSLKRIPGFSSLVRFSFVEENDGVRNVSHFAASEAVG